MHPLRTALLVGIAALLAACGGSPVPPATQGALPDIATFTVGGDGAAAGQGWDGVVEAVQQAVLSAQTSGRASQVLVDVNDRVAAGQVLVRVTAIEQQAGTDTAAAQLKAAEAVLAEAQARYGRSAELVARQLISRADYDLAVASRDSAVAARDAARAQLQQAQRQVDYTAVRAPYAGIVSARRVEPGEVVSPGQALLTVYAPGALRIQVQIPQSLAPAVRSAGVADLILADGRRLTIRKLTVFPTADPLTHAVAVRVELPAAEAAVQPGTTAKVIFPVAGVEPQIHVPASAVVQRGEVSGVYVLGETGLALRQLRLGERRGDEVMVIAGLRSGERVAQDPVAATQALQNARHAGGAKHE